MTGNEDVLFWRGRNFCEKYNIDCKAGEKIVQVMPEEKKLKTENNEIVDFDYLVIASGSSLYAPVKGSDKKGIYNFKTLSGADEIRKIASENQSTGGGMLDRLKRLIGKESKCKTAVIVGGGFIGVEIALCLAKIGINPTLLSRRGWIIPRLLDKEAAKFVENDLRAKGIEVLLNTEGDEFVGKEYVESLLTTDGKEIKGDIYITATGIKSNIDFIKDTDIEYDQGIIVNEKLQTRYPYIK
ncbi:MAG: FAD-dependent oxidoreductase [Deltaproteobacteria bacterium]|nr:FAD-dependent oxidoreductase [Deltaproteobacteria bacterium]